MDRGHRPLHDLERDVEVVDEEVEDDVDVERPGDEDPEAVGLDELRLGHQRQDRHDRRVEALDVPHLEDAAVPAGDRDEPVGLVQRDGHRLFDQNVGSAREQLLGDIGMRGRGGRDDDGRRAPGEQLLHGAASDEPGGSVLSLDLGGHVVVRLDETDGLGEG